MAPRLELEKRNGRLEVMRGFLLFLMSAFGAWFGAPLPRCVLGVMLMMENFCMMHCKPWQRVAVLFFVFLVGPYSELFETYKAILMLGSGSQEYSMFWFDNFVFSLIMEISLPFVCSNLEVGWRAYAALLVADDM